jgi:hypothetical protein
MVFTQVELTSLIETSSFTIFSTTFLTMFLIYSALIFEATFEIHLTALAFKLLNGY